MKEPFKKLNIEWCENAAGWNNPFIDGREVHPDAVEYAKMVNSIIDSYMQLADEFVKKAESLKDRFCNGDEWTNITAYGASDSLLECSNKIRLKILD